MEPIYISRSDLIAMHTQVLLGVGCKAVPGFGGYFVSKFGDVFSLNGQGFPARKMKPGVKPGGYLFVGLRDDSGCCKYKMVHRLVAEAFIQNPDGLPEVNHKDGNKRNNHVSNLEWVTRRQNAMHAFDIGIQKRGSQSPFAKLTPEQVRQIRVASGRYEDIGAKFGVCKQTICDVKRRRKYTDVV